MNTDHEESKNSATLCILFNHPFPSNIPRLRDIYRDRFSKIFFVQPFVEHDDDDVIVSARGSYNFHGMIVDAAMHLDNKSDFVVIVQDDVFLNPEINERNLSSYFQLNHYDAFLPNLHGVGGKLSDWMWSYQTLWKLIFPMNPVSGSGVENWLAYLPPDASFREKLMKLYSIETSDIIVDVNGAGDTWNHYAIKNFEKCLPDNSAVGLLSNFLGGERIVLPYPLLRGMSDFLVVRRDIFDTFVKYLSVFAALQVFVEIAIPTALALAASHIGQSRDLGIECEWLWDASRDQLDPDALKSRFRESLLLVHPIKLSTDAVMVQRLLDR